MEILSATHLPETVGPQTLVPKTAFNLLNFPQPKTSPAELVAFAEFLAREFRFDMCLAENRSVVWYQEQVGADVMTLTTAEQLRRVTVQECAGHWTRSHLPENGHRRAALMSMLPRIDVGVVAYGAKRTWRLKVAMRRMAAIWSGR